MLSIATMRTLLGLCALLTLAAAVVVDKWQRSEDGTLYFVEGEQKFNFYEAWNECARKNMSLLAIEDAAKHQQIDKMIRKLFPTCPHLWLGANDFVADKRFVWIPTGRPLSFTNWGTSQPDKTKDEHCVFILANTWEWHDVICSAQAGYICEEHPLAGQKCKEQHEVAQHTANSLSKYNSIIFNR